MRTATGIDNAVKAWECLSLTTQVLYSFCQTELSERGETPPWQLGDAQEPGPVYFGGSAAQHPTTLAPKTAMSSGILKALFYNEAHS